MTNGVLPTEPTEEKLKQLYDELAYGKEDPTKLTAYLSMRDRDGESGKQFLKGLEPERRARLKREIERIKKLRFRFVANKTKQDLIAEHEKCRRQWRKEAKIDRAHNLEDLAKRWLDTPEPERREKKILMFKNEKRILEAILKWPDHKSEGPSSQEKQNSGLKASIMHFKKHAGGHTHLHKHSRVVGNFPNQKIPIEMLLDNTDDDNPLKESCPPGMFRYFHLPTNNMAWIEKVLKTYYNEDVQNQDLDRAPHLRGPAKRLLATEYWKGQMHGGSEHPVHARHMRPRCSSIPSSAARATSSLPSSRRTSAVGPQAESPPLISTESSTKLTQNFALFMPYLHWETNSRRAKMAKAVQEITKKGDKSTTTGNGSDAKEKERLDFFHLVERKKLHEKYKKGPVAPTKCLGRYLMSIAKIADAMDYEADERLLRDHLNEESLLHIRRTLDQSYFWTMEDTTTRDRDQVVYRGTKGGVVWNARVVMVDQLWLWILDEHTILTSFPRRWGRNKPDPSGVHKSLRERLNSLENDRINSVYDLALMIIDQCSRVFFDRTRPTDQRPEVMDIFSNAIAHVTGMKTVAFETFWLQMRMDSLDPLQHSEKSVRAYLNVNPEGSLLRESQDIVEELRMMLRIFTQQHQVVKDFKKALENLNEREDHRRELKPAATKQLGKDLLESDPLPGAPGTKGLHAQYARVPKSTILEAQELLDHIDARKGEIQELEEAAKRTSQQLQELLTLKQQQASIIEARLALKRADLSIQQGRSIMLFTIVTIIFLPLSFFTGIFGMNNAEWIAHPLSIHRQFKFMFPVSLAVIITSLLLAFSPWIRAFFTMLVRIAWASFVEYSPLHWIGEHWVVSSYRLAEIERAAMNRIRDRRTNRLERRRGEQLRADEEKKVAEQKRLRQKKVKTLKSLGKLEVLNGVPWDGASSDLPVSERRAKSVPEHNIV